MPPLALNCSKAALTVSESLQHQVLVIEQHVNGLGQFFRGQFVDTRQRPSSLGQGEYRYPRPAGDKSLRGGGLAGIRPARSGEGEHWYQPRACFFRM